MIILKIIVDTIKLPRKIANHVEMVRFLFVRKQVRIYNNVRMNVLSTKNAKR